MRSCKQQMEIKANASATDSETSDVGNTDEFFESNITRRKNSFVWEYFRPIEDSKSFECIICRGCVGRQTSNLARHLAFTHNIKNRTVSTTSGGGKRGRPSKSFIWNYCTKQDEKYVRCNLCEKLLYFGGGNTENIAKHLRRKHSDLIEPEKTAVEDISLPMEAAESSDHKDFSKNGNSEMIPKYSLGSRDHKERKGGSYVWNYCDKLSRHEIRCNLCNKMMSFHGTANVITHLQRKHNIVGKIGEERATLDNTVPDMNVDDEQQTGPEEDTSFRQYRRSAATASIVWKYCTRVGRDVARCGFCKKNLSYQGTSNLQRHLHRMHGVVTQMRINKQDEEEFSMQWKNINNNFIWQHCSVIDGEEDKTKCNICNAIYNSKDMNGISKHLWASHGIAPKRRESTTKKRKRRRSVTDDDSSSYENDDFDNWSKQDYSNDAVPLNESNIKKDESFFDEIIEEDPEHENNEEEPFDPSMTYEVPLANPLSPHSSRAPSPATGRNVFKSKKLRQLNEEKVRMETEYFREKAGFYRMQKYLTALQAKKMRNELEKLNNAANVNEIVRNVDFSTTPPVSSNMNTH